MKTTETEMKCKLNGNVERMLEQKCIVFCEKQR